MASTHSIFFKGLIHIRGKLGCKKRKRTLVPIVSSLGTYVTVLANITMDEYPLDTVLFM
jgi:hypothetical protein